MRDDLRTLGLLSSDVLQLVFESSADCIKILDLDGNLLLMNAGGAALMELSDPDLLIGRNWVGFWKTEEQPEAESAVATARHGKVGRSSGILPTGTGRLKSWESVVTPLLGPDGLPERLLVISRDVTERQELALALASSTRRREAMMAATAEVFWCSDPLQHKSLDQYGWQSFCGAGDLPDNVEAWFNLIHPEDRDQVRSLCDAALLAGKAYLLEYRLRHRSGEWRWVTDHAVPLLDDNGALLEWVGAITDIDDRKKAEAALRSSEERLRLALMASRVGIWDVDLTSGVRSWSPELKALLGLPPDAQESESRFFELVHPDDRKLIQKAHEGWAVQPGETDDVMFRVMRADTGAQRWLVSSGRVMLDAVGQPNRRLGTIRDITEQKMVEEQIWSSANQDPLTALANRNAFNRSLERALGTAEQTGTAVGLLLIDVDHFKEVNDTLGHDAGDVVLRTVAERLTARLVAPATVARIGGDEFAVLLPGIVSQDEVEIMAAMLAAQFYQPIVYGTRELNCPISIGYSLYPNHDRDPSELLKNADIALYAAKQAGRARYAAFNNVMKEQMQKRVSVLRQAREVLAHDLIVPFYQPKVTLGTGEVSGFEALLRWKGVDGIQSPATIQEAFDDPELSVAIGQRMLDRVLADMVQWREAGLGFGSVALNVSAAEFSRVDVAERCIEGLRRTGLPPGSLEIEVTESAFLGDGSKGVEDALNRLNDGGIAIALDDFGTGYASLTHLKRFPVKWLKIDRSFIGDLTRDPDASAIVQALIMLAHSMGIRTVAEGVETKEQMDWLQRRRCDVAQGYLIAKPMIGTRVPHFLDAWAATSRPGRLLSSRLAG